MFMLLSRKKLSKKKSRMLQFCIGSLVIMWKPVKRVHTTPSCSDAFAFHIRTFVSSLPESTYVPSPLNLAQNTLEKHHNCIRQVQRISVLSEKTWESKKIYLLNSLRNTFAFFLYDTLPCCDHHYMKISEPLQQNNEWKNRLCMEAFNFTRISYRSIIRSGNKLSSCWGVINVHPDTYMPTINAVIWNWKYSCCINMECSRHVQMVTM